MWTKFIKAVALNCYDRNGVSKWWQCSEIIVKAVFWRLMWSIIYDKQEGIMNSMFCLLHLVPCAGFCI